LDALKNNVSLSDTEKKSQAETLKAQAETIKQKIQDEIESLGDRTDEESKKKKEEAETLLNSLNEITSLYASIINAGTTELVPSASVDNPETSAEEK
jgi:Mg2+ and Co2+ transporter CorA